MSDIEQRSWGVFPRCKTRARLARTEVLQFQVKWLYNVNPRHIREEASFKGWLGFSQRINQCKSESDIFSNAVYTSVGRNSLPMVDIMYPIHHPKTHPTTNCGEIIMRAIECSHTHFRPTLREAIRIGSMNFLPRPR